MNDLASVNVVFDYTNFLSESSRHQWTFVEIFGEKWLHFSRKDEEQQKKSAEQALWESAMKKMSLQQSDETNIVTLIALAKKHGITELKLIMPYDLLNDQLQRIEKQSHVHLLETGSEEFIMKL